MKKEVYKICFFDIFNKAHTFVFNALNKEEANKIYLELKEEHEAYYPKVKSVYFAGTLWEWENLKRKR